MSANTRSILDSKRTKIEQALQVLEEAAKEAKEDVVDIFKEKYSNTKSAFKDLISDFDPSKTAQKIEDGAEDFLKTSGKSIRNTAQQVDNSIHDNPWIYLGASAIVGLACGVILGRKI